MAHAKDFFIELDNNPGPYFPGQTVTGRVARVVTNPEEQIEYLRINFQGLATVSWEQHRNQETYFDHTIQLNQQNDDPVISSLPNGRHSFPFIFHLPTRIPAAYDGRSNSIAECKIFYKAEATFLTLGSGQSETKAVVSFKVERPIDLNYFPWASEPNILEGTVPFCCCCCFDCGPFSYNLSFERTGFLMGEPIEFMAEFFCLTARPDRNPGKGVINVDVWISRTVTFEASDKKIHREIWEKQLGRRCNLLADVPNEKTVRIPFSLNMFSNHKQINSFGSSFMNSIYEFNIEVDINCNPNLVGKIPIAIGTVPFVIHRGRGDNNPN